MQDYFKKNPDAKKKFDAEQKKLAEDEERLQRRLLGLHQPKAKAKKAEAGSKSAKAKAASKAIEKDDETSEAADLPAGGTKAEAAKAAETPARPPSERQGWPDDHQARRRQGFDLGLAEEMIATKNGPARPLTRRAAAISRHADATT